MKYIIFLAALILLAAGAYYLYRISNSIQNSPSIVGGGYDQAMQAKEVAMRSVRDVPEVRQWLALFTGPNGTSPKTGGTAVVQIDSESSTTFTVHVYEEMSDHQSTFGWYKVDKKTGAVTNY